MGRVRSRGQGPADRGTWASSGLPNVLVFVAIPWLRPSTPGPFSWSSARVSGQLPHCSYPTFVPTDAKHVVVGL